MKHSPGEFDENGEGPFKIVDSTVRARLIAKYSALDIPSVAPEPSHPSNIRRLLELLEAIKPEYKNPSRDFLHEVAADAPYFQSFGNLREDHAALVFKPFDQNAQVRALRWAAFLTQQSTQELEHPHVWLQEADQILSQLEGLPELKKTKAAEQKEARAKGGANKAKRHWENRAGQIAFIVELMNKHADADFKTGAGLFNLIDAELEERFPSDEKSGKSIITYPQVQQFFLRELKRGKSPIGENFKRLMKLK